MKRWLNVKVIKFDRKSLRLSISTEVSWIQIWSGKHDSGSREMQVLSRVQLVSVVLTQTKETSGLQTFAAGRWRRR